MEHILSGSYIFDQGTLTSTQNDVQLVIKTEDHSSEYPKALYMNYPKKQRLGRLFSRSDSTYYFDVLRDQGKDKFLMKGTIQGYTIEVIR